MYLCIRISVRSGVIIVISSSNGSSSSSRVKPRSRADMAHAAVAADNLQRELSLQVNALLIISSVMSTSSVWVSLIT